jgi:hypothetical protein
MLDPALLFLLLLQDDSVVDEAARLWKVGAISDQR